MRICYCKVKPTSNDCMACVDQQLDKGIYESCTKCLSEITECLLLGVGANAFGSPYAIVSKDGKAQKVKLHRLYDIREV